MAERSEIVYQIEMAVAEPFFPFTSKDWTTTLERLTASGLAISPSVHWEIADSLLRPFALSLAHGGRKRT